MKQVIGSGQGHQCSKTTLTGESQFHISTPLGFEPGSLMTGSKWVVHWTSETWWEWSEIAGSPHIYISRQSLMYFICMRGPLGSTRLKCVQNNNAKQLCAISEEWRPMFYEEWLQPPAVRCICMCKKKWYFSNFSCTAVCIIYICLNMHTVPRVSCIILTL